MRVIQVITMTMNGGAQTVLAHMSNYLVNQGHKVLVVAGEGNGALWGILDERVERRECPSLTRSLSLKQDIRTVRVFKRIYRDFQPHVIHLHSSKAGFLGRIAFPPRKVLYTVHGYDSIRKAFPIFRPIEYLMQFRCAAIVGVSRYDQDTLREDKISRNVSFVYNGVPEKEVDNQLFWNIPKDYSKTILCVARISPQKNLELFLRIAKLMPEYAFVWIGNKENMNCEIDNVFFLGDIPEAGRYCQLSDLLILTSNYEGLPMTIIEAMSYGKPIVASDVGGISEIVENGINGFVSSNDEISFKSNIESIFRKKEIYERMADNSKRIYLKELTVEKMVTGYMKIYKAINTKNNPSNK
jgi:glycosyltransferase involved in cell wall biosynthesis